ncbi:MAG TPA: PRC-barrel domain-containing protein [Micromonosporaceae bacterium]
MERLDPQTTPYNPQDSTFDSGQAAYTGGTPSGAFDPWSYRDDAGMTGADLVGYKVEATDGGIGKVDMASNDVNASYLVVDTGPWIFGKKVMLPAGVVNRVDHEEQRVFVDRSKDEIKAAPEFDADTHADPAYRDKLGGYYSTPYGTPGSTVPRDRM